LTFNNKFISQTVASFIRPELKRKKKEFRILKFFLL